jgi:hypothetical protein
MLPVHEEPTGGFFRCEKLPHRQADDMLAVQGPTAVGVKVMGNEDQYPALIPIELKAHLPSKDFEVSKQFYQDIGFTLCWSNGGLALLHYGPHGVHAQPAFLLQNYYVKEFAENLQMHLLVQDVDAWSAQIQAKQISRKYGVEIGQPEDRDWKMRDFTLFDPCGVLWRIAQDIH